MSFIAEYTFEEFENLDLVQRFAIDCSLADEEIVDLYDLIHTANNYEYIYSKSEKYPSLVTKIKPQFYSFEIAITSFVEELDSSVEDSD